MILLLSFLGILVLVATLSWCLVSRPWQARPLDSKDVAQEPPLATRDFPPESIGIGTLDETEGSHEEQLGPAGRLSLLGDLAAGIAHEINNPIAIMVEEAGWIEDLLEEETFSGSENLEEFKRALKQIKTQGARCKVIIQNLLSFGRKTSPKVEMVKVNDLIGEVVKACEKRLRAANVKIETHFALVPECPFSPSEMQQVLINLINNAFDAMDSKGGTIDITTRVDGETVVIDVADNGHGIPKAHLDKIFDPFFTTKPVGKGTGLGLSICHGFMEKLGGWIRVESKEGAGTIFHVHIPLGIGEGRPKSPLGQAQAAVPQETPLLETIPMADSPTVVLVVDDEVAFVEAVWKRLIKRGLQALTAFSGEEALRVLQERWDIDIVLLDVRMPGMDGIEVLREIKASRPLVEVILLSAHTTVESAIEGIKMGAFDYLLKPCDMEQLVEQIEKARRRKSRQEQKIIEVRIKEITSRRI